MGIRKLTYTIVLLLAMPLCAKAGMAIGEYKTYQSTSNSSEVLQIYVNGLWEGILWTDAKIGPTGQKQIYCPPKGLVINGPDIKEILDAKARSVSSDDIYPVALVVLDALKAMYPCKK
jgi:hypothetical protein